MKMAISILVLLLASGSPALARDGFEKVRCDDGDIVKALIGQRGSNEPVQKIEERHKDLSLKDLGASDYGRFSSIVWLVCGRKFMLLDENRGGLVRDAIEIPAHAKETAEFEGRCKRDGKPMAQDSFALLRDQPGKDELLAEAAWMIDEKAIKFVKMPTDGLLCPRDGIVPPSN